MNGGIGKKMSEAGGGWRRVEAIAPPPRGTQIAPPDGRPGATGRASRRISGNGAAHAGPAAHGAIIHDDDTVAVRELTPSLDSQRRVGIVADRFEDLARHVWVGEVTVNDPAA